MRKTWLALVSSVFGTVLAGSCGISPVGAATLTTRIDFQTLATDVWNYTGLTYKSQGFTIYTPYHGFGAVGTQTDLYQGSMGIFALNTGDVITLKKDNGDLFSLASIDFADFMGGRWGYHSIEAILMGTRADSTTVSYTIRTDALYGYQTFNLPGFYNLTQVSWIQGFPQHQFDNLVIQYDSTGQPLPEPRLTSASGAPEPTTIAGLLLAGAGLGWGRRLAQRKGRS